MRTQRNSQIPTCGLVSGAGLLVGRESRRQDLNFFFFFWFLPRPFEKSDPPPTPLPVTRTCGQTPAPPLTKPAVMTVSNPEIRD